MAKRPRKRPGLVSNIESAAEQQIRTLLDAAKKRYDQFEKRAKSARTEKSRYRFLDQAYSGLVVAGHMAGALRGHLDDLKHSFASTVRGATKKAAPKKTASRKRAAKKVAPKKAAHKKAGRVSRKISARKRRA
jgi:hypothetical protein